VNPLAARILAHVENVIQIRYVLLRTQRRKDAQIALFSKNVGTTKAIFATSEGTIFL
jgi:hypothetical protein